MNTIDAIRFAAKRAELGDPTLSETALAERLDIARSRLQNFQQGELHKIDDDKILKHVGKLDAIFERIDAIMNDPCLLYTSPSPRDRQKSRMPSSA